MNTHLFMHGCAVIEQVAQSTEHMMKRLDTVMGRVSESVSESKERVIQSLDSLMDHVSASKAKMMTEIDNVFDKVAHSKVIEDIRALPEGRSKSRPPLFMLSAVGNFYLSVICVTCCIAVNFER